MKIIEFITNYISKYDTVDDILNNFENKGIYYEGIYDIIIKCGFCDKLPNDMYYHMLGNVNNGTLNILENLKIYLNDNINKGNKNGVSDITLKHKITNEYIFISSKYHSNINNKYVNDFGINDIVSIADNYKDLYKNYKIYLIVKNKKKVLEIKSNISSKYISKYILEDTILDENDLNIYLQNFKKFLKNNDITNITLNNKPYLKLYLHQELIVNNTYENIKLGKKIFLWGCKCRSGKTYMIGGLINMMSKDKLNVLIITPIPNETKSQYMDMINYGDFNKFTIFNIKSSKELSVIKYDNNYNIIIISKKLMDNNVINDINIDLIIFDETHFSGTTLLSKKFLNEYKNAVKVFLTATYNKPLKEYNIDKIFYWDIEDEIICKMIKKNNNTKQNLLRLINKHENMRLILKKYENMRRTEVFNIYSNMPELCIISNIFDKNRYIELKNKIKDSIYGFSFEALFHINKNKFEYENEVKIFLRYITGSNKEEDFKNEDKSIFTRIKNLELESRKCFIQIWFLPHNNIDKISKNLKDIMTNDKILKNYDILIINSTNNINDVKGEISKQEEITKNNNKHGIIILAGSMLNLGISIKKCDVVMLFHNSTSSDKIIQQMYRCMTEDTNKKKGIVVDLNINRILSTCINFVNDNKNVYEKIEYVSNLINIDADLFDNKVVINELKKIWDENPINSVDILIKNLENEDIIIDEKDQKILNRLFYVTNKINKKLKNIEEQSINSGLNKEKESIISESPKINKEEDNIITNKNSVSFTKDVLSYIIPLLCILTIDDDETNILNLIKKIINNEDLLDIFNNQCFTIWKINDDIINIIYDIINKYIDKKSNIYMTTLQLKRSIRNLLDEPDKLINLITKCLKPKDIEKKEHGEVFTPFKFINEYMLKYLEIYWKYKYKENIWSNHKITFYDPSAGMGNYCIALYYKLMEGLKIKIPDENIRKNHIIKNQLFMSEINNKNCYIIKKIFNNKYLNLYNGDSLNINIDNVFKKKNFNIIITNPPYNNNNTTIYNKFIEYYIDKCDYMSYVTPSRWFSGGKGLDKFREMMLNRTDIVYIKNFNNAKDIFGNFVDIESGVNFFLIDKKYKGLCNFNGFNIKLNKYDIILEPKYHKLIDNILKNNTKYIKDIYIGRYFNINTNDKRLKDKYFENSIKCYVSQQKGFIKYIDKNEIKSDYNFYKVITPYVNRGKKYGFGKVFIGNKNEVYSFTYLSFRVNLLKEAINLVSYLKTKFVNFILTSRKTSSLISENTLKWIPLVPLDRIWDDKQLFKYFNLNEEEIKLINESNIIYNF